ncbi:MAG: NUDIX hydrolase [Candidatus Dormibacteraeota bacterium]|nr:NUDIX hydrolase [Candidatus Dormibacteraeota bacterium]MDQ6900209.1 NUDIX hydrolase [Candidatus Dormibacteraeota bacterium]
MDSDSEAIPSTWRVRERKVDDTRRAQVSIAEVELPDGVRFEQWVLRLPAGAVVVVLDAQDRVLMLRRHRFVPDRWVWELPGGYVDEGEDPKVTASREVEEETGWRPGPLRQLLSFQPMPSVLDGETHLFLARDAQHASEPDVNEPGEVAWIPIDSALGMIERQEILGSASVIGILHVLATPTIRATAGPTSATGGE